MVNMKYLLNRRSFISLMILFSFFDNFGMEGETKKAYDHLFKVLFVGDEGIGKTQIINKFVNNSFSDKYLATIGIDFDYKKINSNGKIINLQLEDTAGQEKFRDIMQNYYKSVHLIAFVYAINNKKSFDNIQIWVDEVKEQIDEKTKFLLVGNKCDLKEGRQVTKEEAKKYAEDNNMKFIEVSAKTGEGISDDMFNSIIKKLLDDMEKDFTYNNSKYIKPEFPDYSIQDIDDIKTSFCNKYCSCCPCLKKSEGDVEEQEEIE